MRASASESLGKTFALSEWLNGLRSEAYAATVGVNLGVVWFNGFYQELPRMHDVLPLPLTRD